MGGNAQTCNYGHDDLGRLSQVDCGTGKWGQSFAYDVFGNISWQALSGHTGTNFFPTYNSATNRYTGTPAYDAKRAPDLGRRAQLCLGLRRQALPVGWRSGHGV